MSAEAGLEIAGEILIPLLEGQTCINEILLELGEAPVIPSPDTDSADDRLF
jgi:hypothetical protein